MTALHDGNREAMMAARKEAPKFHKTMDDQRRAKSRLLYVVAHVVGKMARRMGMTEDAEDIEHAVAVAMYPVGAPTTRGVVVDVAAPAPVPPPTAPAPRPPTEPKVYAYDDGPAPDLAAMMKGET